MFRTSFWVLVLVLGAFASQASAASWESRGYVPYDGWERGTPAYHGFSWRDPEIGGTDARRPDFTQWSGFDKSDLRLKYPLYRDPVHPVYRVATPAHTGYVWPNRTDVRLCAAGIPPIEELCCRRCGHQHCAKHPCGRRCEHRSCEKRSCEKRACEHRSCEKRSCEHRSCEKRDRCHHERACHTCTPRCWEPDLSPPAAARPDVADACDATDKRSVEGD